MILNDPQPSPPMRLPDVSLALADVRLLEDGIASMLRFPDGRWLVVREASAGWGIDW